MKMSLNLNMNMNENRKLLRLLRTSLGGALLAAALASCVTEKEEQARLEAQAKIPRAEAERTALAKVPGGTVKEGELEKEKGEVVWSFDIATPGASELTEVLVDASSGEVVSIEQEPAAKQAGEKKEKDEDDEQDERDKEK